jgi:acetyl-CoA carboxylase biotin carboxyl carrier protein
MANINIESDVTGTVWKVEAKVGQVMSQDEVILIIESMKMEIPVTAPADGKILDIKVVEGDTVNDQQLLVVLECQGDNRIEGEGGRPDAPAA